ncbi:MAG: dihydroneopterin aldolase [Caulobacteraceae bacterium]
MNKLPFPAADVRLASARTFVRDIRVEAEIGVYDFEYGRTQPLVVEVELDVAPSGFDELGDIINYEHIVNWTREVAASGHIELVETFAHRVALACMRDARVLSARVRVEKPEALAPAVAGVEITLSRGEAI